jgi:hypothetical protein
MKNVEMGDEKRQWRRARCTFLLEGSGRMALTSLGVLRTALLRTTRNR